MKIDTSHSEAVFQVRHLVTKVRDRSDDFEGTVEYTLTIQAFGQS